MNNRTITNKAFLEGANKIFGAYGYDSEAINADALGANANDALSVEVFNYCVERLKLIFTDITDRLDALENPETEPESPEVGPEAPVG